MISADYRLVPEHLHPAAFEDEYYWVYFEGDNNLLEKCYFKGKNNLEPLIGNGLENAQYNSVVGCYFKNIPYDVGNGREDIRVWGSGKFQMSPNGLIMFDPGGVGTGQISGLATGSSPYFTSPGTTTGVPLSVVDATIRLNGVDLVELTSLGITMDIQPASPDVFGSGAIKYGPDVFTGPLKVGLDLGLLRKDLTFFQDFIAETQYSLHVLAVENESEPKDFLSIVVPNFTLGSVDPSAFSKQGGGRTQTISVPPALVGVDSSATGNNSMITFQTSAP